MLLVILIDSTTRLKMSSGEFTLMLRGQRNKSLRFYTGNDVAPSFLTRQRWNIDPNFTK